MHSVGKIDWSFVDRPAPASATSSGLARLRIVGPEQGAVHTDLAAIGLGTGKTPLDGLVLGGSGMHPGGGVTGLPGRTAATRTQRYLKKRG